MSCTNAWNTTVWPSSRRAGASWALPSQPRWNASSPPRTRNQGLCVPRVQSLRYGLRLVVTSESIVRWRRDIVRRGRAAQSMRVKTGQSATRRRARLPGSGRGGADGVRASEEGGNRRRAAQSCGTPQAAMPRNFAGLCGGGGFLYPRPLLALRTRPHAPASSRLFHPQRDPGCRNCPGQVLRRGNRRRQCRQIRKWS